MNCESQGRGVTFYIDSFGGKHELCWVIMVVSTAVDADLKVREFLEECDIIDRNGDETSGSSAGRLRQTDYLYRVWNLQSDPGDEDVGELNVNHMLFDGLQGKAPGLPAGRLAECFDVGASHRNGAMNTMSDADYLKLSTDLKTGSGDRMISQHLRSHVTNNISMMGLSLFNKPGVVETTVAADHKRINTPSLSCQPRYNHRIPDERATNSTIDSLVLGKSSQREGLIGELRVALVVNGAGAEGAAVRAVDLNGVDPIAFHAGQVRVGHDGWHTAATESGLAQQVLDLHGILLPQQTVTNYDATDNTHALVVFENLLSKFLIPHESVLVAEDGVTPMSHQMRCDLDAWKRFYLHLCGLGRPEVPNNHPRPTVWPVLFRRVGFLLHCLTGVSVAVLDGQHINISSLLAAHGLRYHSASLRNGLKFEREPDSLLWNQGSTKEEVEKFLLPLFQKANVRLVCLNYITKSLETYFFKPNKDDSTLATNLYVRVSEAYQLNKDSGFRRGIREALMESLGRMRESHMLHQVDNMDLRRHCL
jgi:hypothetical protein